MIRKIAKAIKTKTTSRAKKEKGPVQEHAPTVEQTLSAPQHPLPESPVPGLIKQLRDPIAEVARDAALALGSLQDRSALAPLSAVVLNRDRYFHSVVRSAAAESLGKLHDPSAMDALLVGMRDSIAESSQAAIRALGELGDAKAVDSLIAVVRNADGYFLPAVRQTALETLRKFSTPAATEFLRTQGG